MSKTIKLYWSNSGLQDQGVITIVDITATTACTSNSSAEQLIKDYNGLLLSSLEPSVCELYSVSSIAVAIESSTDIASAAVALDSPLTTMPLNGCNGNGDASSSRALSPSLLRRQDKLPTMWPDISFNGEMGPLSLVGTNPFLHKPASAAVDGEVCVLCLESLDKGAVFRSFCGHSFHLECISLLEGPQCPICRFQHDYFSTIVSCMTCEQIIHSEESCPTAEHNETWMCLICGFVGCGRTRCNHAMNHYSESGHAYAMNTENKSVWDFAGCGYVHRLILSGEQMTGNCHEGDSWPSSGSFKMTEVPDPHTSSHERPRNPPMSEADEEAAVHRKIESVADQYNKMLAWHLQHQRTVYETRLKQVQRFVDEEFESLNRSHKNDAMVGERTNTVSGSLSAWALAAIQQITYEKAKLSKQITASKSRLQSCEREAATLEELNRSLESNVAEWAAKAKAAERDALDAEHSSRTWIQTLEKKVADLMVELDRHDTIMPSSSSGAARTTRFDR